MCISIAIITHIAHQVKREFPSVFIRARGLKARRLPSETALPSASNRTPLKKFSFDDFSCPFMNKHILGYGFSEKVYSIVLLVDLD